MEPGHLVMLDHLGLVRLVNLKMRLGEGTGAVLGMGLLEAECASTGKWPPSSKLVRLRKRNKSWGRGKGRAP